MDYIEQTSWVLFLRYLDDLEQDKADEAELIRLWSLPGYPQKITGGIK